MDKGQHFLGECQEFRGMTITTCWDHVKELKLCWSCLKDTHHRKNCPTKGRCQKCGEKHHTLLHITSASVDEIEPATSARTAGVN